MAIPIPENSRNPRRVRVLIETSAQLRRRLRGNYMVARRRHEVWRAEVADADRAQFAAEDAAARELGF